MRTRGGSRFRLPAHAAILAAAAVLLLPLTRAAADEDEAAAPAPQRVSVENGAAVVKLTPDEIKRSALEVTTLTPTSRRRRQPALAAVLDLPPMFEAASAVAAARADMVRTEAAFAASRAEFERATKLHDQNQNVSTKDLQSAEAAARADGAAARAAATAFRERRAALDQQWGPRLGGWIAENSTEYQRLLKGEARLVRVTQAVPGHRSDPPEAAALLRPDGKWVEAALVSPTAQVSPEFQTAGWYFLVDAGGGLLPGMNVDARLPVTDAGARPGVIVPGAAVVWLQGRAWIFLQTAPGVFTRKAIATDQPEDDGSFFVAGLPAGSAVVTKGAQVLLSEENKPAGAED